MKHVREADKCSVISKSYNTVISFAMHSTNVLQCIVLRFVKVLCFVTQSGYSLSLIFVLSLSLSLSPHYHVAYYSDESHCVRCLHEHTFQDAQLTVTFLV